MVGGVSNVDIDGNNTLEIKAIGVAISTFETLPHGAYYRGAAVSVYRTLVLEPPPEPSLTVQRRRRLQVRIRPALCRMAS